MRRYGVVIGLKEPIAWRLKLGTYKKMRFSTNHSAVFTHDHQTTEFRQTTSVNYVQWLTPPMKTHTPNGCLRTHADRPKTVKDKPSTLNLSPKPYTHSS